MQHRRRWAVWGGVLVIVGVLTIGMWVSAATGALAQTGQTEEVDQANKTQCSVATLKGTYLVSFSGMNVVDSQQVPLAVAGYEVFDGKGKATGVVTVSMNGAISRHAPVSAEYTVNKDCTGSDTLANPNGALHFDLFIAPNGSQFTFAQTDPGSVFTGIETRATAQRVND